MNSKRRPEREEAVEAEGKRSRRKRVARSMPLEDLVSRWECAPGLRYFFQLSKAVILFKNRWGRPFFILFQSLARPEREASESVPVAQALREESTHGRPRAFVGRSCQVYASFQPPSREAGTTCSHAAYMRCIRPIEVHEVPLNYHEAVAYGICTSQP